MHRASQRLFRAIAASPSCATGCWRIGFRRGIIYIFDRQFRRALPFFFFLARWCGPESSSRNFSLDFLAGSRTLREFMEMLIGSWAKWPNRYSNPVAAHWRYILSHYVFKDLEGCRRRIALHPLKRAL